MRSDPMAIFKEFADQVCPSRSPSVAPVEVEVPALPKVQLSWNQKIALLASSPYGEAAYAVYQKLKAQTDLPSLHASDFHALAGMGFAFRVQTERYHKLTDAGRIMANDVAKEIARERGIHAFYSGGNSRYASHVRCVCGWGTTYSRSNSLMSRDRMLAESTHLRTVKGVADLAKALAPPRKQIA
jgi:hypothetical protein